MYTPTDGQTSFLGLLQRLDKTDSFGLVGLARAGLRVTRPITTAAAAAAAVPFVEEEEEEEDKAGKAKESEREIKKKKVVALLARNSRELSLLSLGNQRTSLLM